MRRAAATRLYWILAYTVVVHAATLFFCLLIAYVHYGGWPLWVERLWLGLATLWFFWPLVLLAHPSRSFIRVSVPIVAALPFVVLWIREYVKIAEVTFGPLKKLDVF
jgi:hypothetical protein